jgi:hypothetical protein
MASTYLFRTVIGNWYLCHEYTDENTLYWAKALKKYATDVVSTKDDFALDLKSWSDINDLKDASGKLVLNNIERTNLFNFLCKNYKRRIARVYYGYTAIYPQNMENVRAEADEIDSNVSNCFIINNRDDYFRYDKPDISVKDAIDSYIETKNLYNSCYFVDKCTWDKICENTADDNSKIARFNSLCSRPADRIRFFAKNVQEIYPRTSF